MSREPHTLRSLKVRERLLAVAGGRPDSVLLLYAGRVSPEKNVGLLVETLRQLANDTTRDYRLLVVGDGPQAGWVKQQARGTLEGYLQCLSLPRSSSSSSRDPPR